MAKKPQPTTKASKGSSPSAALFRVLGTLILIFVILIGVPATVPRLFGYELYNIVSGSMEPTIPVGSAVYAKYEDPSQFDVGDIMAYLVNGDIIVHRVTLNDPLNKELHTKGDANDAEDMWAVPYTDVQGKVKVSFVGLGSFLEYATSSVGKRYIFMILFAGVVFTILGKVIESRGQKDPERAAFEAAVKRAEEAALKRVDKATLSKIDKEFAKKEKEEAEKEIPKAAVKVYVEDMPARTAAAQADGEATLTVNASVLVAPAKEDAKDGEGHSDSAGTEKTGVVAKKEEKPRKTGVATINPRIIAQGTSANVRKASAAPSASKSKEVAKRAEEAVKRAEEAKKPAEPAKKAEEPKKPAESVKKPEEPKKPAEEPKKPAEEVKEVKAPEKDPEKSVEKPAEKPAEEPKKPVEEVKESKAPEKPAEKPQEPAKQPSGKQDKKTSKKDKKAVKEAKTASKAKAAPAPQSDTNTDAQSDAEYEKYKKAIKIIIIVVVVLILLLLGILGAIMFFQNRYKKEDAINNSAQQFAEVAEPKEPAPAPVVEDVPDVFRLTVTESCPIEIDFESLWEVNRDVIAWLYCEDTVINYPVLQGEDDDYYLHHSYDHTSSASGSIFIDCNNMADFSDVNTIIYGHHMKNGSMFAGLQNWEEQEYYDAHKYMWLITPEANYQVWLISGYLTDAYSDSYVGIRNWGDMAEQYITTAYNGSDFKADVSLEDLLKCDGETDQHYVMLSTCEYEFTNARYVLHGKLVKE